MKNVLLITAHPDDHVCCAGTIMHLKEKGYSIHEIVASAGEMGGWWDEEGNLKQEYDPNDLVDVRKKELQSACDLIGIDKNSCLGLPDGDVKKTPESLEKLMEIIRQDKPEIIITHHTDDYHPDHRNLSHLVQEAAHKASWNILPHLGKGYKVPIFLMMDGVYINASDMIINVTKFKDKKEELFNIYSSQIFEAEKELLLSIHKYKGFQARESTEEIDLAEGFSIPHRFPITKMLF